MKLYCSNCGKYGHINKKCKEPIISVGMIILQMNDSIKSNFFNNILDRKEEINDFNYKRINNLNKIKNYKNKIKFLLIEKKHSLNYIEFIRGIYEINDKKKLEKMFKLMSNFEIDLIKNNNFEFLWNKLWNKTAKKKNYRKEYNESFNKFNILQKNGKLNELTLINSKYNSPEWELPKGRKNINETNLNCAIREVKEETFLDKDSYKIINNISCLQDIFVGTNNKNYKHIYYLSILNDNKSCDMTISNNKEVQKLKFVPIDKLCNYIRDYDVNKIDLLTKIFIFIMNISEEVNNNIYCV